MMEKEGIIESIESKSGVSFNGKEWTLYTVILDGLKFNTFNELLLKEFLKGDEVVISYEEVINKGFINNNINQIRSKEEQDNLNKVLEEQLTKVNDEKKEELLTDEEDVMDITINLGSKTFKGIVRKINGV